MDITGKVAVVFGGARGIGRAYSEALLNKGAKVCITDILVSEGRALEEELTSSYSRDRVCFVECNVLNIDQIKGVFEEASSKFGQIEIVVNNCAYIHEQKWEKCIDTNLGGNIRCLNTAIEYMATDKGGRGGFYIATNSISGLRPTAWGPVYSATKYGILGLIQSWAENVDFHGIKMNCICPTKVDTLFINQVQPETVVEYHKNEEALEEIRRHAGYHMNLKPSEVAEGLIKLIEEGHNGKALRVTKKHGLDFATFQDQPLQ